ncbi:hypothetical protein IG631_22386 [Alternaria alternata]|nr:hypothetical protein IG631_22386 [Alternaria alternata]
MEDEVLLSTEVHREIVGVVTLGLSDIHMSDVCYGSLRFQTTSSRYRHRLSRSSGAMHPPASPTSDTSHRD